jgi:DNA topoisomerase-3
VCKREITRAEALKILGPDKKTDLLTDFTSRFGRPFSAMLFLKENGRHGFEFAPRQPRVKAGEAAQAEPGAEPAAPKLAKAAKAAAPKLAKAAKAAPKAGRRKKAATKKVPARKAARKKA